MGGKQYVVSFDDASSIDHAQVGGKASSLGRLTRAGFPVPPGFTIATPAYAAFMAELQGQVAAILATADYADAAQLERQATQIRALIIDTALPEGIASAIVTAYTAHQ